MSQSYEKLSSYAARMGVKYQTAWTWFRDGKIEGAIKLNNGIFVPLEASNLDTRDQLSAVTYSRVSSSQNKKNLEAQSQRLYDYSVARGYRILRQVKETGSGLNDKRKQLESVLNDDSWSILVVEHKDRLTRFGFHYLEIMVRAQGRRIEVVNLADEQGDDPIKDITDDLVSIITSFTARIYGARRSSRKTEKIIQELSS